MRARKYPSDLAGRQRRPVRHPIPAYPGGRPRTTPTRGGLGAVFYPLRTGCQWRHPPQDFPPESAVRRDPDEWRHNGAVGAAHDRLREKVREQEGRRRTPPAGSTDGRSGPAAEGGEERGYDAHKKVAGRKRHVVVDTPGLLLAVVGTAASADDGAAAKQPLARVTHGMFPRLRPLRADSKYHNHGLYGWAAETARYGIEAVRRPGGKEGWVTPPGGGWWGGRPPG